MPAVQPAITAAAAPLGVSWPLVVALAAFAASLAGGQALLGDPDTMWHVAVGRWIIARGAVPSADILSHSMADAHWVDHEWLAQVVMALSYEWLGWHGLAFLAGCAAAAALALFTRAMLRLFEPQQALLAVALAWSLIMPHWLVRPHVLVLPLLVLWTILLVDARAAERAPPAWAALLMVAWVNLHGSFLMGLGLAGLLAAEAVFHVPGDRLRAVRQWTPFLALATAATLVSPSGLSAWWLPFRMLDQRVSLSLLIEWRSPDFQTLQPVEIWIVGLLALALVRGIKLPLPRVLMLLLFVHLALKHTRHGELLGLVGPLLIGPALAPQLRTTAASGADRFLARLAAPASRGAIAVGIVAALAVAGFASRLPLRPPDNVMPEAAVQAALHDGPRGPVLNELAFGGYLALAGIPVFVDGRVEFYGDAFVARAADAFQGGRSLSALLDEHRIAWTLLPPTSPAVGLLDRLPGWRRLHADAVAVVHVREPS